MIEARPEGLYSAHGDFYVDPWQPVARAVITHAHADHAHAGHGVVFATHDTKRILAARLPDQRVEGVAYGEALLPGVTLHPAGHILGSAQVRIEADDVTVVSGDYKRQPDPTCAPFEVLTCDTFVTEATFALPVYRWRDGVIADINAWWNANKADGRISVLFCYALGKAQRILHGLSDGEVFAHGAVLTMNGIYGIDRAQPLPKKVPPEALVLAPPSAIGSPWMRRFKRFDTAFASGTMQVRGNRRRRSFDRGFVLSDHADWPALLQTVAETKAKRVLATHGFSDVLARHLREQGLDAAAIVTQYQGEADA